MRLEGLLALLRQCEAEGIVTAVPAPIPAGCVLGWRRLEVHLLLELRAHARAMVERDDGGVWKGANGKGGLALRNASWVFYELFRKIGVKPRGRGAAAGDPGRLDMLYYEAWEFVNDTVFERARERLRKGFCFSPEAGGRARKRACVRGAGAAGTETRA
jgi:hypothetical protein